MSPPEDLLGILDSLIDILERLGLGYAVGGAIAQNAWGTVRATQDIDVLVSVPRIRFEVLRAALSDAGFTMRDSAGATAEVTVERMVAEERERHLFAVYKDLVKVEIFLPFLPLQHAILRRAVKRPFGRREVPLTTAEDLVVLKMVFHREKDLRDIRGILLVQRGQLDLKYLNDSARAVLAEPRCAELERLLRDYAQ